MVDPIHTSLLTVPEGLSHLVSGYAKSPTRAHSPRESSSASPHSNTMPIIGGHKTLSSLLHISSGSQKSDGRAAFSPYTGSLTSGGNNGRGIRTVGSAGLGSMDSDPAASMSTTSMGLGTSVTLNVRYVAKDMWRKVTFPPGITVTQARDICMLRFNIWQQTLDTGADSAIGTPCSVDGATFDQHQQQRQSTDVKSEGTLKPHASAYQNAQPPKMGGATAGLTGAVGGGAPGYQKNQMQFREQYGLFWTSAGHWLEADEMLSTYIFRKGEVLELQHIVDFVPLQPHEFRYSYAESYIYHLEPEGAVGAVWQQRWMVLRNRVLRVYKNKGAQEADIEIDLTQQFRLTDQEGRSWPRSSQSKETAAPGMSSGNGSSSSLTETPSIQALLDIQLPSGKPSGESGIFVLQFLGSCIVNTSNGAAEHFLTCGKDSLDIQSCAFRSCSIFDYQIWHRTLRHTLSSGINGISGVGGAGTGCSMSGSASISGASNNSHGVPQSAQSSEITVPTTILQGAAGGAASMDGGSGRAYATGQDLSSALSPNPTQKYITPLSPTRYEGYVNREAPGGYGFRRRFCVLMPTALYGFLHADNCKGDVTEEKLLASCEFSISLDPSTVTIEAIAWNGRYLLRIFGPESQVLRDKPRATALHPTEPSRIHCTDILATAAEAIIEQYGSTFGMLPDSQELVRLMVDDHDEGQMWVLGFNSIAGLQITGHSRVIISARRTSSLTESKQQDGSRTRQMDEGDLLPADTAVSSSSGMFRQQQKQQQSLGGFIADQVDSLAIITEKRQPQRLVSTEAPATTPRYTQQQQQCQKQTQRTGQSDAKGSSGEAGSISETKTATEPKWIPLNIDKYVKEEEERKRHQTTPGANSVSSSGITSPAATHGGSGDNSGNGRILRPKASNVSESEHGDNNSHHYHYHNGYGGSSGGGSSGVRMPPRFNWFKRRGSTSK
ncbi:hypothetical protein BX070DRAFT_218567 [Coemansia spiralis]|nr:hypothetical protein BX070DRAFT_218567 [Coemansia spiralis]